MSKDKRLLGDWITQGTSKADGIAHALNPMFNALHASYLEAQERRRVITIKRKQRRILLIKQYTLGLTWLEGQRLKGL